MSVATPPPAPIPQPNPPPQGAEGCPLCGTPLRPDQEWCLHCGAAARTRLASTPNWRTPLAVLGLAAVLGLGALTASLVALAGGPKTTPASTTTRTVTSPAAGLPGTLAPGASTLPGASTTSPVAPGASIPGASTATAPMGAKTTTGAGKAATIPGTHIRLPGTSTREAGKILNLLSPHGKR